MRRTSRGKPRVTGEAGCRGSDLHGARIRKTARWKDCKTVAARVQATSSPAQGYEGKRMIGRRIGLALALCIGATPVQALDVPAAGTQVDRTLDQIYPDLFALYTDI